MSKTENGSALIVGLIFLLILTVLGAAGMRMARYEITMAGNEQFYAQAFNAAEAAVEVQIADGQFNPVTAASNLVHADTPADGRSTIRYLNEGMAPDGGYSDDLTTYRFQIDAVGQAPDSSNPRATVRLRQGIYVLAPGSSQ